VVQDRADKAWVVAIAAIYLCLALAAFVPGVGLAIRNDLRYLAGNWYSLQAHTAFKAYASGSLNSSSWRANTRTSRLATALESNYRSLTGGPPDDPRLRSLEGYCDANPADVEAWAHLARMATQGCQPGSDASKIRSENWGIWSRSRDLELKASANGMRLEPNNCYFPLIYSGAKLASGEGVVALEEFLTASKMTTYRDYFRAEQATIERAVFENHGELTGGDRVRIWQGRLLPHCAYIKNLAKLLGQRFPQRQSEVLAASSRVGELMMRSGDTVITSRVGAYMVRAAAATGSDSTQLNRSAAMIRAQRAISPQPAAGPYPDSDRLLQQIITWRPRVSASALAATLAAFPITCLMAWGARRRFRPGNEGKHLLLPFLGVLSAALGAVALVIYSASMPKRDLALILIVVTVVAGFVGSLFAPAGKFNPLRIGAIATIVGAVIFAVAVSLDVRIDRSASDFLAQQEAWEQRVLQVIR
jgi:hypothetical protein